MKYNDNGTIKEISVKASDTLPIGSVVEFDGDTIPSGWEEVTQKGRLSLTTMLTSPLELQSGTSILTGTIITKGGDLLVNCSIGCMKTSAGNSFAKIVIDNSIKGDSVIATNKTEYSSESGTIIISDIPAGTHTIKLHITPNEGYTAYINSYNEVSLTVIEI